MNGQPAPPPPATMSRRLTALPWWAWLGVPLLAWVASRAFVMVLGMIASLTFGRAEVGLDQAVSPVLGLFGSWDTTWYLDIARRGYAFEYSVSGDDRNAGSVVLEGREVVLVDVSAHRLARRAVVIDLHTRGPSV